MDYKKPDLMKARKRTKEEIKTINFSINEEYLILGRNKKYFITTFGCQANEADSEVISGILNNIGFERTYSEDLADLIILNTCAIRESAENRFWGTVGSYKILKSKKKDLIIAVCGCMPQEEKTITNILRAYPQISIVFGTHNIHLLPEYIDKYTKNQKRIIEVFSHQGIVVEKLPYVRESNNKAWVNIMYGCDEFCTYCIVPFTRGRERSRKAKDIIEEVKNLVLNGYIEITLLGQNVNAYGKDFNDNYTFGDLLNDLNETGIERIRFTTSHPKDLDEKTIKAMSLKSVMPHLHLPVQSGSNSVLKLMNRKYTRDDYISKIKRLREVVPDISITTDIIVGFPNETEEDFNDTISLVKEVGFEGAYTFIYSQREGTPAAKFNDDISMEEKHKRLNALHEVVNEGYVNGHKRFVGETVKVLIDGVSKTDKSILSGHSEHNKIVNFTGEFDKIGQIVLVKISNAKTWFMMGEQVKN